MRYTILMLIFVGATVAGIVFEPYSLMIALTVLELLGAAVAAHPLAFTAFIVALVALSIGVHEGLERRTLHATGALMVFAGSFALFLTGLP